MDVMENDGNNTVGLHTTDDTVLDDIDERRTMPIKLIGHPLKHNAGKTEEYQRKTFASASLKELDEPFNDGFDRESISDHNFYFFYTGSAVRFDLTFFFDSDSNVF